MEQEKIPFKVGLSGGDDDNEEEKEEERKDCRADDGRKDGREAAAAADKPGTRIEGVEARRERGRGSGGVRP